MANYGSKKKEILEMSDEIAELIKQGKTPYAISQKLRIDYATLKRHMETIDVVVDAIEERVESLNKESTTIPKLFKRDMKKPIKSLDLINKMKHRADQLLSINVGDVIKIDPEGDATITVTLAMAKQLWDDGKKIAKDAMAEETKIKQFERDADKNCSDVKLENVLIQIINNKPLMDQSKNRALMMQQEVMKKIQGKVIEQSDEEDEVL